MILSVFITVISGHDKPQPPGCLLDAYYLQQERIFRKIYNILSEKKSDDESVNFFRINPMQYEELKGVETLKYTESLFSKTVILFHAPLFLIIIVFFAMSS